MEKLTLFCDTLKDKYSSLSSNEIISQASKMLKGIVAFSDKGNTFVANAFRKLVNITSLAGRAIASHADKLDITVSTKLSQAAHLTTKIVTGMAAKTASAIRNDNLGRAICEFCTSHPAFVAGVTILSLVAITPRARQTLLDLLKLTTWDLPLSALAVAFKPLKMIVNMAIFCVKHPLMLGGMAAAIAVSAQ